MRIKFFASRAGDCRCSSLCSRRRPRRRIRSSATGRPSTTKTGKPHVDHRGLPRQERRRSRPRSSNPVDKPERHLRRVLGRQEVQARRGHASCSGTSCRKTACGPAARASSLRPATTSTVKTVTASADGKHAGSPRLQARVLPHRQAGNASTDDRARRADSQLIAKPARKPGWLTCARAIIAAPRSKHAPCPATSPFPAPCPTPTARCTSGHLVGYIQADIWVRAQRMARRHGALRLRRRHARHADHARRREGRRDARSSSSPAIQAQHERDFADFDVAFDHYDSTHSDENRAADRSDLRARSTTAATSRGASIEQFYDPVKGMFLPDRYIKGICPNCGTPDQYGDNCEICGATYAPTDLKEPALGRVAARRRSCASPSTSSSKSATSRRFLRDWLARRRRASRACKAKLREWLDAEGGLRDWDISRDAPYFGFEIPGAPGQVLLRLARCADRLPRRASRRCASATGVDFDALPRAATAQAELHHFIGKDIVNFHGLFWPAVLHGAGFRAPTAPARQRLPHRQRREDVEVARHLRHGAHLPRRRASIPKRCATTSPPSPAAASTTST